jgi:hypothetical protein
MNKLTEIGLKLTVVVFVVIFYGFNMLIIQLKYNGNKYRYSRSNP